MRKSYLLSVAVLALSASVALASPNQFKNSGDGFGNGAVSSFSGTAGLSATGVIGNGGAEQSAFSGAAQSDQASFGTTFEDGMITIESGTLSQGETFSSSEGFTYGNAFGATGSLGVRAGFAAASGEFETDFKFKEFDKFK